MTGELHQLAIALAEGLRDQSDGRAEISSDGERRRWLAIQESVSNVTFVEAEGSEFHLVPFVGDEADCSSRGYVESIGASWVDGEQEVIVNLARLDEGSEQSEVLELLMRALDYWVERAAPKPAEPAPEASPPESSGEPAPATDALPPYVPPADVAVDPGLETASVPIVEHEDSWSATMRADVSPEWSWASSVARIPQTSDIVVEVPEPVAHARITVTVADADLEFGSASTEGALDAGTTSFKSLHVPLSARVMSQVTDRQGAHCTILLEDVDAARMLARFDEVVDIQPRDLWLWAGDPRRSIQRERQVLRAIELDSLLDGDPDRADAEELRSELGVIQELLAQDSARNDVLSRSLLAAFVRPNHPEIAALARESAEMLANTTGDGSFHAFQIADPEDAAAKVEASVTAMYETLRSRRIAYSDPPPNWDYRNEGQRIRDHGDVARGGLGTCMDTTVLTAAVMEHVGLNPVLVLVPGHIFVGYWRRDPDKSGQNGVPDWHPRTPFINDISVIHNLVEGGYLGLIETTALTVSKDKTAADARSEARDHRYPMGESAGDVSLIDVAVARRGGVSPLPAVNERADGIVEVVEFVAGGATTTTEVPKEELPAELRQRQTDTQPARYRTWKSSLFSLNATNDLLNLKSNARVQPIVLPSEGLPALEDMLNQDVTFALRVGYDVPEVFQARDVVNAVQFEPGELMTALRDRTLYTQRWVRATNAQGSRPTTPDVCFREVRAMANAAKSARTERGMNPLFLCLGMLRWPYKKVATDQGEAWLTADAPLILVPVNISLTRGRKEFTLSLDTTSHTTPNAALIEWLRREHGLHVPGLAEPVTDHAGIDVGALLNEVRNALLDRSELGLQVVAEARLATLDLSAFRMWQDLNTHAEEFLTRPLVRHLVHTPTHQFEDPSLAELRDDASEDRLEDELESLETPIPADATQKKAVLWARQGRTFVLQGPPGTGKSQTITNMVAECVLSGLKVLFVAEKGTALAVVQRRLEDVGLGPFTLNLHHEGSNAAAVRDHLKRSLGVTVTPDHAAMDAARARLRRARFELGEYPRKLHERNAAGYSAYAAHDEQLVLGEGTALSVPSRLVAHHGDQVLALKELFADLQRWTSAAGVRPDHPWRLAGVGNGDPFDVESVIDAIRGILTGHTWSDALTGPLRQELDQVTHPAQLQALARGANPALPPGDELAEIVSADWPPMASATVGNCEESLETARLRLRGFSPDVLAVDLAAIMANLVAATESSFLGRNKRVAAAIAPLASVAPAETPVTPTNAAAILDDLLAIRDVAGSVRESISAIPGLRDSVSANPFQPGALAPARARLDELVSATKGLRSGDIWARRVTELAQAGDLAGHVDSLTAYAEAWQGLWNDLVVSEADFEAWRDGRTLAGAVEKHEHEWRDEVDYGRLLPLQQWSQLVRLLEPLREAGLEQTRVDILEGSLAADVAEEALNRGVADAALRERMAAAGLDRFDSLAHDERVTTYVSAQREVRKQWATDGPVRLLQERGGDGAGANTGGLARELEKTRRKLGTRAILRKYGAAVQELTPLVLCSPSSVVDLIEPGVMEFDVVIFDEASQITVPEAVGALGRARAAIVVGDTKQMPPTRKVGGPQTLEEELEDEAEEIVEDQESILSESELARVPMLSLSWHYRSQDEALIAFSNRTYYRGDLSSFPTPTLLSTETGLEFRRIRWPEQDDKGMYRRAGAGREDLGNGVVAGANTNPIEGLELVEYVHELVNTGEQLPSIGIVTFNEPQRQLIEDLLLASNDPRIVDVMDETKMGRGDVLFVKALEQVQGDERDVVIFSVAFSKQANGKIPTNFGPLSNSGGERRLNVAVSRARRRNVVFCSFDPGELEVASSSFKGPKDLKEFLLFARRSASVGEDGEEAGRAAIRDRHRDDVADALREAGLHVMSDVGLSNFRLDLVLSRPERPDRPILPVLLDGESWQQRITVSDRDVLPVEVLENLMGWPAVARIWWPMWLQNRQEVIDKILAEVDRAETALPADPVVAEPDNGAFSAAVTVDEVQTVAEAADISLSRPDDSASGTDIARVEAPEVSPLPVAGTEGTGAISPRQSAAIPALGEPADRSESHDFSPAHTNVVGERNVLDTLSDRRSAAAVREQLLDVIEAEGPVELSRLVRLVARRFDLSVVRANREQEIAALVPRNQMRRDRKFGAFAWPVAIDPSGWGAFRVLGPRSIDEVAPQEIANAMLSILSTSPGVGGETLIRRSAELLGINRIGANVRARLEGVYDTLPAGGGSDHESVTARGPEAGRGRD